MQNSNGATAALHHAKKQLLLATEEAEVPVQEYKCFAVTSSPISQEEKE